MLLMEIIVIMTVMTLPDVWMVLGMILKAHGTEQPATNVVSMNCRQILLQTVNMRVIMYASMIIYALPGLG
jgi:hypothetical protein